MLPPLCYRSTGMTFSNRRRRRSVAQRVSTVATILLVCCIEIWTSQALSVVYHAPDSIREAPERELQRQKGSASPEVPSDFPETRRMSSILVNQHALLQVQVSVVCTLSNEAKTNVHESSSHSNRCIEDQLDMDTRWVILINELPQFSLDDDSSIHLDQAFVLNWLSHDDFRFKGHASLSFLIPLQDSATIDERTLIVTLMENSSDSHPRITSRRLANLPFLPSYSNLKNSRTNMVVNVELSGSTTCVHDYKAHLCHEGTLPQNSGAVGWAMALVACIAAYVFPKDSPRYVPQDEAPDTMVASLPSTRLHLPERPHVENDDSIESSGHNSVGSLVENESALCRRDDSADSDASTPGSGPRIEKPPQLVRIPCAFIFTEDEESVAYHNDENRHGFPSPDVAEPDPYNDELGEKETESQAMNIMESADDSRKTYMILVKGMANQEAGAGEPSAHFISNRRINKGKMDTVANEIDSQELPTIVDKYETVDRDLSKYETGHNEQEDRFIKDQQAMEVTVDDMEPSTTCTIGVEDTSEKHQTDADASSVAIGNMDQRTGDVVVDASEPNATSELTENQIGVRRSKVIDLEYLPVTEPSNWLHRLRERPANKVTSSAAIPNSDIGFLTVDDGDRDSVFNEKASGGASYVSTLPADSDRTCSPMNDWPQTVLDTAMDFACTADELNSEPARDDSRALTRKRQRRFDPFKSHRNNDQLLPSASIHAQDMCPVETSSWKQASTASELSPVVAHHQQVDAVPNFQTVAKKSAGIKKELKRSKYPALPPDFVPSTFLQSFCTQQIDAPIPWDFSSSTSPPKRGTRKRQRDNEKRRKGRPPTTINILGDSARSRQPPKSSQRAVSLDSSMTSNRAHKSKHSPAAGKRSRPA